MKTALQEAESALDAARTHEAKCIALEQLAYSLKHRAAANGIGHWLVWTSEELYGNVRAARWKAKADVDAAFDRLVAVRKGEP